MWEVWDACPFGALVAVLAAGVQARFGVKGLQGGGAPISTVFSLRLCVHVVGHRKGNRQHHREQFPKRVCVHVCVP